MKILVYGAGPFGSLFSQRLTEAGHDVYLLARGKRLDDLKEHGVVIEDQTTGVKTETRVPVVDELNESDHYDLVIVTMRKNQAIKILPVLAANKKVPTFLFMMNNAEGQKRLVEAVGKSRVLIGFPLPGGGRDGHVMRMISVNKRKKWTMPIGEVDGRITERTREIARVLGSMRGYKIQIRRDMDDWLKCHVGLLIPALVPMMYATKLDLERTARTRDALVLGTRGLKESLRALRRAGVKLRPSAIKLFLYIPEPLMFVILRKIVRWDAMEGAVDHLRAAQDEMVHLREEFFSLIKTGGERTPVLGKLQQYFNPETPPIPDGSSKIPLNWKGVWLPLLLVIALVVLIILLV